MSRIGIVALSRPELGGTFQYTLSMIDALKKIPGNEYIIYTSSDNHFYDDVGISVARLPSPIGTLLLIAAARLLPNTRLFADVDKVIAPIYSTRLLASRRPFIMTIHDLQEKHYPKNFSLAQRIWRQATNLMLSRAANGLLCESSYVRDDITRFLGVAASKVSVIPAPPVSAFVPEHLDAGALQSATAALDLPPQFLFYPAQFFAHKNHIRLVEAFALVLREFPECRLLLTGQPRYEFTKVMARVRALGLEERVRHLGYVDTPSMAALYARATLVVVPTLFESISIPAYEAFRLGAALCISNVVGLPEQVGDAGVLFDPFSINDMAQKISEALGNEGFRGELIARGKARINAFTAQSYAAQLEALLNKMTQHG